NTTGSITSEIQMGTFMQSDFPSPALPDADRTYRRVAYAIVALVVFLFSFFKIADLDFWWHLKTGQIIVQQKQFQYQEIYSFTCPGRPYVDHEWLFQVFQYLAFAAAGITGVILLKCAILILIY